MQQVRLDEASGKAKGVKISVFVDFFGKIVVAPEPLILPQDAPWFMLHPDLRALIVWDWMLLVLAIFYFWGIPFEICFDAGHRRRMFSCLQCCLVHLFLSMRDPMFVFRA
jgi:hypothetical protein